MTSVDPHFNRLIIGIDGGGTKTVALLGQTNDANEVNILGEGFAGPSNQRAVGPVMAMSNLDKAVQFAFDAANMPRQTVEAACLGLAGADRDSDRSVVERWAEEARLAHKVRVVNDAVPLLYAASDSVAQTIITASARDLAEMVLSVARQLNLTSTPLFFTGALLLSHESYRNAVKEEIINRQIRITSISQIPQPATGAVRIAEQLRIA